jgi:hypothetical protein
VAAGFVGFAITWKADVFSGAAQSSSAAEFGTVGITFRARKATSETEWQPIASVSVAPPGDAKGGMPR